jgi:hypothetical protein
MRNDEMGLTLLTPTTYELIYTYGMDKAGTRGFSEGAITKNKVANGQKANIKTQRLYIECKITPRPIISETQ